MGAYVKHDQMHCCVLYYVTQHIYYDILKNHNIFNYMKIVHDSVYLVPYMTELDDDDLVLYLPPDRVFLHAIACTVARTCCQLALISPL